MNEMQYLFQENCRPLWRLSAKQTGRAPYLCKQRLLIYLSKLLGVNGINYKQFEQMSDEDVSVLFPKVIDLLLKVKV